MHLSRADTSFMYIIGISNEYLLTSLSCHSPGCTPPSGTGHLLRMAGYHPAIASRRIEGCCHGSSPEPGPCILCRYLDIAVQVLLVCQRDLTAVPWYTTPFKGLHAIVGTRRRSCIMLPAHEGSAAQAKLIETSLDNFGRPLVAIVPRVSCCT